MEATLSQNVRKLMAAVVRVTLPINGNGPMRQLRLFTAKDASDFLDIPQENIEEAVASGKMAGLFIDGTCHVSTQEIAAKRREMLRKRELSREMTRMGEEFGLQELNEFP